MATEVFGAVGGLRFMRCGDRDLQAVTQLRSPRTEKICEARGVQARGKWSVGWCILMTVWPPGSRRHLAAGIGCIVKRTCPVVEPQNVEPNTPLRLAGLVTPVDNRE